MVDVEQHDCGTRAATCETQRSIHALAKHAAVGKLGQHVVQRAMQELLFRALVDRSRPCRCR